MKKISLTVLALLGAVAFMSTQPAKSHTPKNNGIKGYTETGEVAGCGFSGDECYWSVPVTQGPGDS